MAMDLQSLILVVDDDPELRSLITEFLGGHGYRVQSAENALQMNLAIERERPDLVVLDVMMPGEDGLSAARRLAADKGPPVIILSALGGDTDRIIGLEVGADDYLAKPCNPRELLARVRAVLRRTGNSEPVAAEDARPYGFAGWRLDVTRRDLRDPTGIFINLSDGEFALLRSFVEHPQRILSRDQLLDLVHGGRSEVFDRAIDTQISRLRRKLNDRVHEEMIRTVRNEGYMLVPRVSRL
jgi:two-component system, OmpR family, response regulator